MKKSLLFILLSLLVLGCSSEDNNSELENIDATLIAKDGLSGNGEEGIAQRNMVINDEISWNSLITKMNSVNNESDKFSETDIDFSQFTVIAVFDKVRESGGFELELDITSNSENIVVNVTDKAPQGYTTTVMDQPYHIVKIATSDLPILFE